MATRLKDHQFVRWGAEEGNNHLGGVGVDVEAVMQEHVDRDDVVAKFESKDGNGNWSTVTLFWPRCGHTVI